MSWKRGKIVYCKDKSALKRLDEIRRKAAELFASNRRYEKADQAYSDAKKMLAEVYLAQSVVDVNPKLLEKIQNVLLYRNAD